MIKRLVDQIRENGINLILIVVGILGIVLSSGHPFGEYVSLFVAKPAIKVLVVGLIAEFGFRKVDFQGEIVKGNLAVAVMFFGLCFIVAGL